VPLKTKEKGMVGKPAEPTVAPGGSVAAAAWVAGAGELAAGVDEEPEADAAGVEDAGGVADAPEALAPPGRRGRGRALAAAAGDLQRGEVDPGGVRDGLQLVDERGERIALGHGLPQLGHRGVVLVVAGLGLTGRGRLCLRGGQLLGLRGDLRLQVSRLLALGREAEEPEPGERGGEQHADDDKTIASGHGVVVVDAVWAPLGVVGVAKKRVIENCG
jgi:hypothetical protein